MKLALALVLVSAPAFADEPPAPAPPSEAEAPPPPPVEAPPAPPSTEADADHPAFRTEPMHKDIVITVPGDRDAHNLGVLAAITGAGVLLAAVGVYYNLDSKSAADEVSAKDPKNAPWTAADQATLDRGHSSAIKAGVFYGLGGAALVGAIVTYIVTAPQAETTVIHPHYAAVPTLAPAPGGAVLGGVWRF